MMYKFMELNDKTEINYSDPILNSNDGKEQVKVYIEQPIKDGFNSAECYLPDYEWKNVIGFSNEQLDYLKDLIESTAHLIIKYSRNGGFDNAANI